MRRLPTIACALLAATALSACGAKKADGPPAGGMAPPVSVAAPLVQDVVDWDDYVGRFEAVQRVEVRPRVSGYLQQIHFRDGQFVKKGQLLFSLDARPFQAQLSAAKAEEARARAGLTLARAELERARRLLDAKAVSQQEVDQKQAAVAQSEAGLAAAQAAVQARALDVEFTRVVAPVSGRVSDRRVDAGNLVGTTGEPLTTVVSTEPIHFTFEASEALLLKYQRQSRAAQAAPVRIRLQDEGDYRWSGQLDFSDNALDASSGTVRLRAVVNNPGGFIKPGMFGHAKLQGSGAYKAMLIPDAAVVTDGPRKVALVVGPDGTVAAKPLQLGPLSSGGLRVVRGGLAPTDKVIVDGVQRARPGQKVTPKPTAVKADAKADAPLPVASVAPAASATPAL
ncbi:efflux RND transporter periplasmic adaptor subunit [Caulobacter sp. 17J80-11]|uniref:efflux RND transporter periplasmic adaptor subunit n=1 Tax=Caulobacter sp. 17J80-11 TaxID=2763502 RepID=UPI0016536DCF|nr:efflux RND transporter periplasmic adaptor subunit [Caulobacter sp. 17J80-11]MBC6981163.1 efflux RND transporter periplasmic adaptor subunit [Caulobacter sp. 17J80-11]